jgi:hypothetical protein
MFVLVRVLTENKEELKAAMESISSVVTTDLSQYLGSSIPRKNSQVRQPMMTLEAHSNHIKTTYSVMAFLRFHDAMLCRNAFTAVKTLQAMEKPHTKVVMYMSSVVGAGTLYHGGTRNPVIAYDSGG